MRLIITLTGCLLLTSCMQKGGNPEDPFESINRKTHAFNTSYDKIVLKPAAIIYVSLIPGRVRTSVNNAYENVDMIPTVVNDVLQAQWHWAIKDTWRFIVNSTFGVAGLFDVATSFSLPRHNNDLGITFARWGLKKSPYIVVPFLGPTTIRDGVGELVQYAIFTPYPYINDTAVLYSILGLRYVDLRSQLFETEKLMDQSLDKYAFLRDAWLQHRHYAITGEQPDSDSLFVEETESTPAVVTDAGSDYVDM